MNKDELRRAGYTENPDGSWSKKDPPSPGGAGPAKPKPAKVRTLADGAQVEDPDLPRRVAIITVYTCQRVDPDNLGAKWIIDSLRHLGVLEDDTSADLEVVFASAKADRKEEERTEVELYEL